MSATDQLTARLTEEFDADFAAKLVASLSEDQAAEALAGMQAADDERAALKARLMADTDLRTVVTPHTSWDSPEARYQVAKTAVAILEATATKHDVTLDALVQAMLQNEDSLWQEMTRYKGEDGLPTITDPRFDGYGSGNFYAFRCRVRDALALATEADRKAAHEAAEAKREARWESMGMERCTHCGGAGGFKHWPGFTCYECGGEGAVAQKNS